MLQIYKNPPSTSFLLPHLKKQCVWVPKRSFLTINSKIFAKGTQLCVAIDESCKPKWALCEGGIRGNL